MPQTLYDDLSPFYHLIVTDWDTSITRQGEILEGLMRQWRGDELREVLDVACNICNRTITVDPMGLGANRT